ncbi:uncharacterized protein si:ch211-37e10.2 [Scyliorhinus canicula]|uniref:uncharacterized protein si:ch211-37e10.2 n=1 Tax=Scyliorhinus canicula TaxID=7830 RepID=UPI0018F6D59B|nr:uncharacterized protein si:ch211-37e10.2 [Scyliorhinus canicula]
MRVPALPLLLLLPCLRLKLSAGSTPEICRGVYCYTAASPERGWPCTGAHCRGRPSRGNSQDKASMAFGAHPRTGGGAGAVSRSTADPNTILHAVRRKENARVATAPANGGLNSNDTKECKGIECRLPLRSRLKPKARAHCAGEHCPPGAVALGAEVLGQSSPVHMPDRAAQFIGEIPDLSYSTTELGGAALGVQLTCDIKPGDNEVPSEDALILQLQLSKGQEKFVEMLKSQQKTIGDLQQRLTEQQAMLINQQREILVQQRKMFEQMELVKVQYTMLFDTIKQTSLTNLQAEVQSQLESHLQGLQGQIQSQLQKTYAVHKVELDAKVIGVGDHLLECGLCQSDEYCDFQKIPPQCERCTMCPAGFFQVSECSATADRICQDKDECLELVNLCGDRIKCLNTPGGFRCLGIAERDIASGFCGRDYFFNKEIQECQACSLCEEGTVALQCSLHSDSICTQAPENHLSGSWSTNTEVPSLKFEQSPIHLGLNLPLQGKLQSDLATNEDGRLVFKQHGLIWVDYNFAIRHNCRNFLQLSLRLNEEEGCDLSSVRVEQPEGKYYQSSSVSGSAEVEPSHTLHLFMKSPNQFCNQSNDFSFYPLQNPFSFFWLSHDTGAVAMSAHMASSVHYQTNYRPVFKVISISDPYMITLFHDGRAVRFTEQGVVKFVYHQALYAMGHTCIREGFTLLSYINRNGTNEELMQVYKSGVNYRDTSISASGAAMVNGGDTISFQIHSPAQCSVRYFGDTSGLSVFSLIWIPSAVSSALLLAVSGSALPTGAVKNKFLSFQEVSPVAEQNQIALVTYGQFAHKYVLFHRSGVASLALNIKLIHSCDIIKVTLNRLQSDDTQPSAVARQIGGQMPVGSQWTSVGLSASFAVWNGTMAAISLDCVRGRINQIAHGHETSLSIMWVSS